MSGIAIKNISRIKRENIKPTLDLLQKEIFDKMKITPNMWDTLGSTGKKPESGDLDIGLDISQVIDKTPYKDEQQFGKKVEELAANLGWQVNNRIQSGFKMIHLGIPIVGQEREIAQVDIMLSNDMTYTKFRYFSPSNTESKYKGQHRSKLFDAILKICSLKNESPFEQPIKHNGITYPSPTFSFWSFSPNGFIKTTKTFLNAKGTKLLSSPKKLNSYVLTTDPQKLLDMLFGTNVFTPDDFNSFETIWNNVLHSNKFKYKNKLPDIINEYKHLIDVDNSYALDKDKVKYPTELE